MKIKHSEVQHNIKKQFKKIQERQIYRKFIKTVNLSDLIEPLIFAATVSG